MKKFNQTFLFVYSLVVTVIFLGTEWINFKRPAVQSEAIKELIVQRIKIVEPDGTLRMVISDHSNLPGIIVRGKEEAFDRPQAGMLFYNDEGSENGGLIFGGSKNAKGEVVNSGGSLSFDRYQGNQEVQLIGVNDKDDHFAGLRVSDSHPNTNTDPSRIWVGRNQNGDSQVALMDSTGKQHLILQVSAGGKSSILFLDNNGKVSKSIN